MIATDAAPQTARPLGWPRGWRPTDAWVRWLLVPAVAFIALATSTTWLADFWHHLARGRAIVTDGKLLDHDIFTFTVAGASFQDVNWLTQVIYYLLYQLGGLDLVRVINALLVAGTMLWLVALCRRLSGSLPAALGLGIVVFLGLWNILTIRPQTFSLLLFVGLYDGLERARAAKASSWRLLVLAPLTLAVWSNLHGAFPIGIVLIGCFALAALWDRFRGDLGARPVLPWFLAGALALAATLINPYGWNIYRYVGQTSGTAAARGIDEWLPPTFDQLIGVVFYLSIPLFVGLSALAWRRRSVRLSSQEGFLLLAMFPLACSSVRMAPWWLIVIAPMAARRIAALWPTVRDVGVAVPNRGAAISCGLLTLAASLSLPGLHHWNPLLALRPADPTRQHLDTALAHLQERMPQANVFTRFEWGEYLGWAAHPQHKVFMDGRIEIYPEAVWDAYAQITQGQPGWAETLDRYDVDAVLLDVDYHGPLGLLAAIDQTAFWRWEHQAGNVALFVRVRDQK